MKDAELADIIRSLIRVSPNRGNSPEPECTAKVNQPFAYGHHTKSRLFDKVYSGDGLTVFVEFELGKKKSRPSFSDERCIVTVSEQAAYTKQENVTRQRLMKKIKRSAKKGVAVNVSTEMFDTEYYYSEGPLVDHAKDTELTTARVNSVLAQYDSLNLAEFSSPDWKRFVEMVAKRYVVGIAAASDGTLQKYGIEPPGVIMPPGTMPRKKLVYQQRLTADDENKCAQRINDVYLAGSVLQRALNDQIGALAEKYLKPFSFG